MIQIKLVILFFITFVLTVLLTNTAFDTILVGLATLTGFGLGMACYGFKEQGE